MRTDLPVYVLKLRPHPLHAGTIGIARSLARLGADVHVIGERQGSPVARSRYVRSVIEPPSQLSSQEERTQWLHDLAPPGRPLLIAVDDTAAVFVQQKADTLIEAYRFPRLPGGLVSKLVDKAQLSTLASAAGVPSPAHAAPLTREQLDAFVGQATFPVVVKVRDPDLLDRASGVRSVEIGSDASQVSELWSKHLVDGQPNCILQEYIPGGPDTVWMVNAYVDETSILRFAATGRKVRQYPPYTGATALGVCERNDDVLKLTAQLVGAIRYRGILDVGWRFDVRDGSYKLLDFNPRIGATFRLFVGATGLDVLQACYLDMTAQGITSDAPADGRRWVNDAYDLLAAVRYIKDGNLSVGAYLRSFRNVKEAAWWAGDDRLPALAMVASVSPMVLSSASKRVRVAIVKRLAAREHKIVDTETG